LEYKDTLYVPLASSPYTFIKICQNTPQLCWEDEWPTLSPGGLRPGRASGSERRGGIYLIITPTLILPPAFAEAASRRQASRGRKVF